ncbi:unnamed protein product [Bursaphelenchus okinawaensis]|uniref:Uncharacterized protein n=1 Tax=Bursaphelenchus okinawaensis TaxID=465554 RepID=A0A811JR37_9BILA|nr:unnamed protein product [Bursaphelenchus okinawaensis]CAG9079198.1 unnamed protein product [Bursaphelenchus okinawaensis]
MPIIGWVDIVILLLVGGTLGLNYINGCSKPAQHKKGKSNKSKNKKKKSSKKGSDKKKGKTMRTDGKSAIDDVDEDPDLKSRSNYDIDTPCSEEHVDEDGKDKPAAVKGKAAGTGTAGVTSATNGTAGSLTAGTPTKTRPESKGSAESGNEATGVQDADPTPEKSQKGHGKAAGGHKTQDQPTNGTTCTSPEGSDKEVKKESIRKPHPTVTTQATAGTPVEGRGEKKGLKKHQKAKPSEGKLTRTRTHEKADNESWSPVAGTPVANTAPTLQKSNSE